MSNVIILANTQRGQEMLRQRQLREAQLAIEKVQARIESIFERIESNLIEDTMMVSDPTKQNISRLKSFLGMIPKW